MSAATIEMVGLEGSGTKLTSQQLDNLDSRVEGSLLRHGKRKTGMMPCWSGTAR